MEWIICVIVLVITFLELKFHDRHKVYKVIIEKDIYAGKEAAGIIYEGDNVKLMFFPSGVFRYGPTELSPHQTSLV